VNLTKSAAARCVCVLVASALGLVAPAAGAEAAVPRLSVGSLYANATTAVVADPAGDDLPGADARGDLLAVAVRNNGTTIDLGATTRTFESPTSHNWEGLALGDPFYIDGTGIEWRLDVNGDKTEDFTVFFQSNGSRAVVKVARSSAPTTTICSGTPTTDGGRGYFASFRAGCLGKPGRLRTQAFMTYETPTNVSSDLTAWTSDARAPVPGYWMVGADGSVHAFGNARSFGSASTSAVTHLEPTPTLRGYWIVNAMGRVFSFGDAHSYGSAGALGVGETVTSLSTTPTGQGYWIFTSRGRVLRFGDARFFGDLSGTRLNGPVVGSVASPSGRGYYMVAADGGVFTFGDARFHGSMGNVRLNAPVLGLAPTLDNRGYWLVAADGGVFSFNAPFRGSMGGVPLNKPVVGIVRYGAGYLLGASDGGVFTFSNLAFAGSLGAHPPTVPIVGLGATA
jgi:hypothetical protein